MTREVRVTGEVHQVAERQAVVNYTTDQLALPVLVTREAWITHGRFLGRADRVLGWAIAEWWNAGEAFGDRVKIVTGPDWDGPSHQTCRNYASVDSRIPVYRRHYTLSFGHHAAVAALPTEEADRLLAEAARQVAETGSPPSVLHLRQKAKAARRVEREQDLGEETRLASRKLGSKLYGVIYADPPWRFEPRSRDTGMDRAADNHYPTMTTDEICALKVPAAKNAVLFLWATPPMLCYALRVLEAWGFEYRSHMVWYKDRLSTGYWVRGQHELLLIGVKGKNVPAPAMGDQPTSVMAGAVGKHSEKPASFAKLILRMYPSQDRLEMFARKRRKGFTPWGNEVSHART